MNPARLAHRMQLLQDVLGHGVTPGIAGRAHVQAELHAARHHIDRALGHMQHAHRGHRVAVLSCALFHVDRPLGKRSHRIMALVHGAGARMAGCPRECAQVAHAAVDGGDDAQGHVQTVQHRPLLDVYLHKTPVMLGLALELRNVVWRQACRFHGVAHGHALRVSLFQPIGLEIAHQGRGCQKCGLVSLAFFFGKSHHFQTQRPALACACPFTHTSHGHEHTQASIVFATVANRVVVTARQQVLRACSGWVVAAHHIAHCIDVHLVKTTGLHAQGNGFGASLVGWREVSHTQLTLLGKARVAELGQPLVPVPHLAAQHRVLLALFIQTQLGNAVNLTQTFLKLHRWRLPHAPLHGVQNGLRGEPQPSGAAHRHDERPAELGQVLGVERLQLGRLFGCALPQARHLLLLFGFVGEVGVGLGRQQWMGFDECQLR